MRNSKTFFAFLFALVINAQGFGAALETQENSSMESGLSDELAKDIRLDACNNLPVIGKDPLSPYQCQMISDCIEILRNRLEDVCGFWPSVECWLAKKALKQLREEQRLYCSASN